MTTPLRGPGATERRRVTARGAASEAPVVGSPGEALSTIGLVSALQGAGGGARRAESAVLVLWLLLCKSYLQLRACEW